MGVLSISGYTLYY